MANQGGGLAVGVERTQQAPQCRGGEQVLHRRMAAWYIDCVELPVTDLLHARQADHRRVGRRGELQFLQQRLVLLQALRVAAEVLDGC